MAAEKIIVIDNYDVPEGTDKENVIKNSEEFNNTVVTKYAEKYIDPDTIASREIIKKIDSGIETSYTIRFEVIKHADGSANVAYIMSSPDDKILISLEDVYTSSADFKADLEVINTTIEDLFK